jgi:hypothetical protein
MPRPPTGACGLANDPSSVGVATTQSQGRIAMSVLARFAPASVSTEQYDESVRPLDAFGERLMPLLKEVG